mmetsp:Transcript_16726/g.33490  ORF Transcript_16726/g.33490 Transcript_16726/m.33490 type:complete len:626 (-) Transcript_16726:558-2435(-)
MSFKMTRPEASPAHTAQALAAAHNLATRATEAAVEFSKLKETTEEAERAFAQREHDYKMRVKQLEQGREEAMAEFREYQSEVDARIKSMSAMHEETLLRMTEEKAQAEAQLEMARRQIADLKTERDAKALQLKTMTSSLEHAANEARRSAVTIQTLQAQTLQAERDRQEWAQEKMRMNAELKSKELVAREVDTQHSLDQAAWQQVREEMLKDMEGLHQQLKQRMQAAAETQSTIEQYKRMEANWTLERRTLQEAEAAIRAKLSQVELDLGAQIQEQERSIEHAQQALGATATSLNSKLFELERELTSAQSEVHARDRELSRLHKELKEREASLAQLRTALEARREAELRLEKQLGAERAQRDQLYESHQESMTKSEQRHAKAMAEMQEAMDRARTEWEMERRKLNKQVQEDRAEFQRKEQEYNQALERSEREAEAAATSLQEICASADRRLRTTGTSLSASLRLPLSAKGVEGSTSVGALVTPVHRGGGADSADASPLGAAQPYSAISQLIAEAQQTLATASPASIPRSTPQRPVGDGSWRGSREGTPPVSTQRLADEEARAEQQRLDLERELARVREMNRAFESHLSAARSPARHVSRSPDRSRSSRQASPLRSPAQIEGEKGS